MFQFFAYLSTHFSLMRKSVAAAARVSLLTTMEVTTFPSKGLANPFSVLSAHCENQNNILISFWSFASSARETTQNETTLPPARISTSSREKKWCPDTLTIRLTLGLFKWGHNNLQTTISHMLNLKTSWNMCAIILKFLEMYEKDIASGWMCNLNPEINQDWAALTICSSVG